MCGRFTVTGSPEELRERFGYIETPNFPPRYNIAPSQPVPIVRMERGVRHFSLLRWGFVPSWAKEVDEHGIMINARAESILQRASFKNAMKRRRALFMANGFYEWQNQGRGPKQPFYIQQKSGEPFAIAGIWEHWMSKDGAELETAALITVDANIDIRPIHHRMPAILARQDYETWLDTETKPDVAASLLKPVAEDVLETWPVSTKVNSVVNDSVELTQHLDAPKGHVHQPDLFD